MNALSFCRWRFSNELRFYTENGRFAFLSSPLGSLWATCDVHHRLIGKLVVVFLLVITEPFSLGVTAEALQTNIDWKLAFSLQRDHFDSKFQVEGVAPYQPPFVFPKYDKRYFMWYKNVGTTFFHFVTNHAFARQTEGRTDGQTALSWLDRVACNACIGLKTTQ